MLRCSVILAALAAALSLQGAAARAASIDVNPIRVDLSSSEPTVTLVVRNTGVEPTVIQLGPMEWTQADGRDGYAPTRELLATPPVATIPPGGEQIIRAALRREPDAAKELAFRLYIQEVPPPPKPGFVGLQVALRLGIPVFVAPAQGEAAPKLAWTLARDEQGLVLSLANAGNAHVRLTDITLSRPSSGDTVARHTELAYVLGGQTRTWRLPLSTSLPSSGPLRLRAQTGAGEIDTQIEVQRL